MNGSAERTNDTQSTASAYRVSCGSKFWQTIFLLEANYIADRITVCKDVFSIGCGPANVETHLAKRGFSVTGLDVSQEALCDVPDAVRTVIGRAEDKHFPDASFDAVLFVVSLQFIDDYRQAISRAVDVLRPGGTLIALLLDPQSRFFQDRCRNEDSYIAKIKHTDIHAIEKAIAVSFDTDTEYFLSVNGESVTGDKNASDAALCVITGKKRVPGGKPR